MSGQIRLLAMLGLADGWSQQDIAEVLGVSPRSVRRWRRRFCEEGEAGLLTRPRSGRPPKLNVEQVRQVLSWLDRSACDFGYATDRWTAPRLAALISEHFGVRLCAGYLNDWLRRHGVTPQMPQRQPRERSETLIQGWMRHRWPRIKKRLVTCMQPSVSPMKAAFSLPR